MTLRTQVLFSCCLISPRRLFCLTASINYTNCPPLSTFPVSANKFVASDWFYRSVIDHKSVTDCNVTVSPISDNVGTSV